mgnify:CR=1 FL=1
MCFVNVTLDEWHFRQTVLSIKIVLLLVGLTPIKEGISYQEQNDFP